MASVEDIGIDLDFGIDVEAETEVHDPKNDDGGMTESEKVSFGPVAATEESRPSENETSTVLTESKVEESSSDDDFDLNAPVGGSAVAKEDDDDEFDFELTTKTPPAVRIEITPAIPEEDKEKEKVEVETEGIASPESRNEIIEDEIEQPSNGTGEEAEAEGEAVADTTMTIQWKTAQKEWDDVKDVKLESDDDDIEDVAVTSAPVISSAEALDSLRNEENVLSLHRGQIVTSVQRSGFRGFLHCLFGPPRLKSQFIEDRDTIFAMALHPYHPNNETHFRMLLTTYKSLTGNNLDCPKFGSHWDAIGFQGNDPGTDFRGTGILGLLCFLHLCAKAPVGLAGDVCVDERSQRRHQLSLSLHRLSQDAEQNFPLAIMSINWTRLLLQTLREGCLNKTLNAACTSQGMQLCQVFLELHVSLAFRFASIWQREHKTIVDSGLVLRDLEDLLRRSSADLLKEWLSHASQGSAAKPKGRAERYAAGTVSSGDGAAASSEGVAELSMLN